MFSLRHWHVRNNISPVIEENGIWCTCNFFPLQLSWPNVPEVFFSTFLETLTFEKLVREQAWTGRRWKYVAAGKLASTENNSTNILEFTSVEFENARTSLLKKTCNWKQSNYGKALVGALDWYNVDLICRYTLFTEYNFP